MNKVSEILILITVLSVVPVSIKLAFGETNTNTTGILDKNGIIIVEYANKLIEDNIVWSMNHDYKQYSLNAHQIDKWTDRISLIFQTCHDRYVAGEYLLMSMCNNFASKYNQHLKQLFDESRPEVEKIVLDY
jgi:hypothetical protein